MIPAAPRGERSWISTTRWPPTVSGPLTLGSTLQIDSPGCFLGQGGFAFLLIGTELPPAAWIPIQLRPDPSGVQLCHLVTLPEVVADVTLQRFPLAIPIPNDPALRGHSAALQTLCRECGFAGCYDLLTAGLRITLA